VAFRVVIVPTPDTLNEVKIPEFAVIVCPTETEVAPIPPLTSKV
jgi:hypothetical protein